MDFVSLAKKGYEAYNESQQQHQSSGGVSKTGGAEFNAPHSGHGPSVLDFDDDEVTRNATDKGTGERSLFTQALSFISGNKDEQHKPIDDEKAIQAHEKVYNDQSGTGGASAHELGVAAALQVLKQFTSGSSGDGTSASSSGGNSQTQLISLAMAEATKLFDKSGGSAAGGKQDAVNGAAMTVVKLLVQSKLGGGVPTTGPSAPSSGGGLGGLLSLASKFT